MPGDRAEPLTAAEWKVMNVVWRRKRCAAGEVCEEARREHGWAPSTVKTLLRRLVDKGYLQTTQVGNSFLYRPSRGALQSLRRAADTLLGNALEGTVGPLLAHMVKRSQLSADELAELRALLDDRTEGARRIDSGPDDSGPGDAGRDHADIDDEPQARKGRS